MYVIRVHGFASRAGMAAGIDRKLTTVDTSSGFEASDADHLQDLDDQKDTCIDIDEPRKACAVFE